MITLGVLEDVLSLCKPNTFKLQQGGWNTLEVTGLSFSQDINSEQLSKILEDHFIPVQAVPRIEGVPSHCDI